MHRRLATPPCLPRAAAALALAALVALSACARAGRAGDAGGGPGVAADAEALDSRGGASVLEVRNLSNFDLRVSVVVGGGMRRRLGLVISQATTTFPLDASLLGRDVRLLAEPVGFNRSQRTDAFLLRPGQHVVFGLERLMRSHTLAVHFQ